MQRNFRWALSDQEGMSYLAKKTKKGEAALILSNGFVPPSPRTALGRSCSYGGTL